METKQICMHVHHCNCDHGSCTIDRLTGVTNQPSCLLEYMAGTTKPHPPSPSGAERTDPLALIGGALRDRLGAL